MRILSIGVEIDHPEVTYENYGSSISLLDFDVVLYDPSDTFLEYTANLQNTTHEGFRNLDDDDSVLIQNDIKRRNYEFDEFLKLGRVVIVMLPSPTKCFIKVKSGTSGTGKGIQQIRYLDSVDLVDTIPALNLKLILAEGDNIEFKGDTRFKQFYERIKNLLRYSSYLAEHVGNSFLVIRNTDKEIATWIPTENGILLLIPTINILSIESDEEYNEACNAFISAIKELIDCLKGEIGGFTLPEWSSRFFLPNESECIRTLNNIEEELQQIIKQKDKIRTALLELDQNKILFCGNGKALEKQVTKIMEKIGLNVSVGTTNRADLIVEFKGKVAVVEIKGTSKSAAESHSRQLEQWISEYCITNDIAECKGILIINAFSNSPLNERISKHVFPDSMLKTSTERNHCLITTLQLLGLYYSIQSSPEKRDDLISELFDTVGIYPNFNDYHEFIEET